MTLATASADGEPSARTVLLKGADDDGFVFYTNYESAKARDLAANPRACLLFFWAELERQVRITGAVTRVSREESAAYFHSRPLESQIGAWVSPQSRTIPNRGVLEENFESLTAQYRRRRCAGAAVLGRLPRHARAHRVLAGPPEPPARSPALHEHGDGMDKGEAGAVRGSTF